jgi:hypothetical protein
MTLVLLPGRESGADILHPRGRDAEFHDPAAQAVFCVGPGLMRKLYWWQPRSLTLCACPWFCACCVRVRTCASMGVIMTRLTSLVSLIKLSFANDHSLKPGRVNARGAPAAAAARAWAWAPPCRGAGSAQCGAGTCACTTSGTRTQAWLQ